MPVPTSDFLILGYGPVGATLAALLTRYGHTVTVVDQATAIYDKPRAISLDHEALRVLQAAGLTEALMPFLAPHTGTDFLGADGAVIQRLDPMAPPFPLGWWPNACFIQPLLEAALRTQVTTNGGATLLLGWQAVTLIQNGDGVSLTLRDAKGDERAVAARYLLACDGANSFVRRELGIGVEDLTFDEWWMVVDTRVRDASALPKKSLQYCRPSRPASYVVGPLDLRRWEIKLLPGEDPTAFGDAANVHRLIGEFADLSQLEVWRSAVYRFHAVVATRWRSGRAFLLGDACHQMPPFLGQGLCGGIRDVGNLAWKLDMVVRGRAADELLDSYEVERKPHVRAVVAYAKELGQIVGELDPARAADRDRRLLAAMARGETETIRQKFIPDLTAGIVDAASGGGRLFAQPRIWRSDGREMLLDDAVTPGFLIAVRDPAALGWLTPEACALWRSIGGTAIVIGPAGQQATHPPSPTGDSLLAYHRVTENDGLFAALLEEHRAAAIVVRPDRYIYATARDAAALDTAVARLGSQLGLQPGS
ncbi:MAG TPA: bifunctional 3-(3-hydroxy-phenyl)propionate/3-hydroxycinnamic acid hydroxylase [Pseudolabrys sp.]|nr:bifunctional 3-(3-hydroxy-phenyl)propionate/3-hydroxycinnamic acid hydroxylase [Pseudolabrys sp.]